MVEILRELKLTELVNDCNGDDIVVLVNLLHNSPHYINSFSFLYHIFADLGEACLFSARRSWCLRDDRRVPIIYSVGNRGECTSHKQLLVGSFTFHKDNKLSFFSQLLSNFTLKFIFLLLRI